MQVVGSSINDATQRNAIRLRLVPLATDPGSQMNIFGHDGHSLGMDGTQVGVLEETHEIRLCRLLQSKDRMALETQVTLHMCIYI